MTSRGDPTGGLLPMFFFPRRDLLIGLGLSLALVLVTGFSRHCRRCACGWRML